ncbi:MAG: MOSC domain-containing protein [Chloroflexi bacterium]|jgi:MOSC domain-containing protein YiiM|nr:MOSC domain-containing protein [Chloroflexota bacterium]
MSIPNGLVTSVQVGIPEPLETSREVVPSSICRRVLSGRVPVTRLGLAGNEQADLVNHGGADKAVCVYFSHHYSHWESRLGFGLTQGAFGENLTMSGFDETTVCIVDVMTVGTVRVQISQPR